MTDKLEKMTRAKLWQIIDGLYAEIEPYSSKQDWTNGNTLYFFHYKKEIPSFSKKHPSSKAECIEWIKILEEKLKVLIELTGNQVFTGIAKCSVYSPVKRY